MQAQETTNAGMQHELVMDALQVEVRVPSAEDNKAFAICFELHATASAELKVKIHCEYWAFFASTEPLTQAFLESNFTSVNVPAIAYPYLRSFVTASLVNAGYTALYLPTLNFVERNEQEPRDHQTKKPFTD